jgi:hypothetical protein
VLDLDLVFTDPDLPLGDGLTYTATVTMPIDSLVAQVSQSSYTTLHQDLLYTRTGDNRGVGGWEHDLARENIQSYFVGLGLDTSLEQFTYNTQFYYNVVGVYPGVTHPNDIYLVGAHYDSVNNPGADDNASGVAAVMELARVLTQYQFDATLVFVAFDREEQGLWGSKAYANAHAEDNILGMLSLDMIAYNIPGTGHDTVRFYDYVPGGAIKADLAAAFAAYGGGLATLDSGQEYGSDHSPFEQKGFDAALVIEYAVRDNPYYHRAGDAVETANYIDYVYATKVTRGVLGYLATAAGIASPSDLLTVTVSGQDLILDYAADAHGIADIRVRATDTQNLFVEDTFRVTVTPVNDAPLLDNAGAMTLAAIDEDPVTNPGTLVRDIVASAGGDRITDVDQGALEGIAVTAVDNAHGTWQYTINNGRTWLPFGTPTAGTARLLGSDAGTRVRFVPAANWNGTVDAGLTFRAWDHTTGGNGGTADATLGGGATAFSASIETAVIIVNPINDPPAVALQNTVASISEGTDTSSRIRVADIVVTDDGQGTNLLSVSGPDASLFEIAGGTLYLKAGTLLDFETNPALEVTVAVDDATLGTTPDATASLTVAVTNVVETFIVLDFSPTATGFAVQLQGDIETSVLNLYDQGGDLGPPDVTLVGANVGPVRGSLVVHPALRQLTFIKTAGLLEPDTYTVTLHSGATALRDTAGRLLDGNADEVDGGDYVTTFVVSPSPANAVTVSLPDVTRGYGQPVNLPADNPAAGLPLTIHHGQNVGRVEFELRYDSRLLAITAFTLADSVASRGALSELQPLTPGVALLTITAPTGLAEDADPLIVGSFTARVPDDAPYGGKHVLDIAALRAYDTAPDPAELPALDDDGIHVAAFFGDTSGDRSYNSPDATLVRRVIGQVNTGFSAYPLADPVLIADITLNGRIQSNDTTNIRRANGQAAVPNIPPLPSVATPPEASGADPRIFIPRDLVGGPGETVTVPVMIEVTEAGGLTIGGFDMVLEFDPARFTVSQAKLGGLFLGTDVSGTMTQPAPGQLIYTADSLVGTSRFPVGTLGDLLTLTVAIGAGAAPGPAAWNLLASLGPSRTGVYDAALEELVLYPPLTNASGDAGDGLLLVAGGLTPWHNPFDALDVNGDGQVTPLDALIVINRLNAEAAGEAPASAAYYYYDVNDDTFCTAQDVLIVINHLNAQSLPAAEGEHHDASDRLFDELVTEFSPLEDVLDDLADDIAGVWR